MRRRGKVGQRWERWVLPTIWGVMTSVPVALTDWESTVESSGMMSMESTVIMGIRLARVTVGSILAVSSMKAWATR